jgi:hypothetical protein
MSQTVIFSVGIVVFALTIWGVVMTGGIWFDRLAALENNPPLRKPASEATDPEAVGGPST